MIAFTPEVLCLFFLIWFDTYVLAQHSKRIHIIFIQYTTTTTASNMLVGHTKRVARGHTVFMFINTYSLNTPK